MYERLVTHSGSFHADDVFSAALLRRLCPEAPLERTRDAERLAYVVTQPQIAVFDVGDHDEPERGNFDHHQRSFDRRRANGVPYASIGLVWSRHGLDYVRQTLAQALPQVQVQEQEQEAIARRVEERLIWALDAADYGELVLHSALRRQPEQGLHALELSSLVALLHPPNRPTAEAFDAHFVKAMELAQVVLEHSTLKAQAYFQASRQVSDADDGGPLLVFAQHVPWYEHVQAHHRFVLSPAFSGEGWMIETVQDEFVPRCALPLEWAGLRGQALAERCGVQDAIFCHRQRFIASAQSLEGARQMARQALERQGE